mgnify:CR=1 FL=1
MIALAFATTRRPSSPTDRQELAASISQEIDAANS